MRSTQTYPYPRTGTMRITVRPSPEAAPLRTIAVDLHTANRMGSAISDQDSLISTPSTDATGRTYRAVVPSREQVKRILAGETLFIDMPPQEEKAVFATGLKAAVSRVPMSFFEDDKAALTRLAAGAGTEEDVDSISALLYSAVTYDSPFMDDLEVLLPQFVVDFVIAMQGTPILPEYLRPISQWLLPQLPSAADV